MSTATTIADGTPIDSTFYDGWKVQQVLDGRFDQYHLTSASE